MPRVHEIAAAEFLRMSLIVAPAFLLRRRRRDDLARQQRFDGLGRRFWSSAVAASSRPIGERALPKQLARRGEFVGARPSRPQPRRR